MSIKREIGQLIIGLVAAVGASLLITEALYLLPVSAQISPAPGVITVTKTSSISAVAGGLRCTVSTANSGGTISVYCYSGTTLVLNASATVFSVTDQPMGPVVSYSYNGDVITCMFWRPATGAAVNWQVAANGTFKEGTF